MRKGSPIAVLIVALLVIAAAIAIGSFQTPRSLLALAFAAKPERYVLPVRGVRPESLVDSFQVAGGAGAHRALDIFCVRGSAVLAPTRGLVISVGSAAVRLFGPGAETHMLSNVVPREGLVPWQTVEAGDVLGEVDDPSGAERGSTPHLHYALTSLTGRAVNPYPLLVRNLPPALP